MTYLSAAIEEPPFKPQRFDKIFSVEVAQHFRNFSSVALSLKRLLKPDGKVVLAAHFSKNEGDLLKLKLENLFVDERIDILAPVDQMLEALKIAGFKKLSCSSIGAHVFAGYEKWLNQIDCKTPWSHKVFQAYQKGYIDYYLIDAS